MLHLTQVRAGLLPGWRGSERNEEFEIDLIVLVLARYLEWTVRSENDGKIDGG
jgi:hypothetical protein